MDNCNQLAIITKDLCLIIYGRDARTLPRLTPNTRVLRQFLSGAYKKADINHISAVYELTFKRLVDCGSPGVKRRQRRVLDTSGTYVRGEENLNGWQPRGDSLLFDHQWELEKMTRLELVERVRHILLVREKLSEKGSRNQHPLCGLTSSGSRMNLAALAAAAGGCSPATTPVMDEAVYQPWDMTQRERDLCLKCIGLIQTHIPSKPGPNAVKKASFGTQSTVDEWDVGSSAFSSPEVLSPDRSIHSNDWPQRGSITPDKDKEPSNLLDPNLKTVFVPEIEEIRLSPVISRKGTVLVSDERNCNLVKRWAVVRRPYLFIYLDEKDPIERLIINLANVHVEYSEDPDEFRTNKSFSISTKHRTITLQGSNERDCHDWLYAINPLLAGQIRSKTPRDGNELTFTDSSTNQCYM